jgi:hypothetical protein
MSRRFIRRPEPTNSPILGCALLDVRGPIFSAESGTWIDAWPPETA